MRFEPQNKPVPVVLDTDMATDCDDAGAMALLHALEQAGEVQILGIVTNNRGASSIGAVAAINSYFGRDDIPLGAYKGDLVGVLGSSMSDELAGATAEFGHTIQARDQVPSAVELYRRVLATRNAPDVVIVSIGHLNNLHDLLASGPDGSSDRDGLALVQDGVAHAVVMGGAYPEGKEHNFHARGSAEFTAGALDSFPRPILFSGYELGVRILTGTALARLGDDNPVTRAYRLHPSKPLENGRPSWDQTAVLAAIRGPGCFWTLSSPGHNKVETDGSNRWIDDPNGPHAYLIERDPPETVAAEIDRLMTVARAGGPG